MKGQDRFKYAKEVRNVDTGEVFKSLHEARRKNFIKPDAISKCCLGKTKTSAGYRWEYTGKIIPTIWGGTRKRVKNIDTGEIFKSAKDARDSVALKNSSPISRCCKGRIKKSAGYRWMYIEEKD